MDSTHLQSTEPVDTEEYINRFLTFLDNTKSLFTRTPDNAIGFFEHIGVLDNLNNTDETC